LDLFGGEPTGLVKRFVLGRAVEDNLVAIMGLGDFFGLSHHPSTDTSFLEIGMHDDILDMQHVGTAAEELWLDETSHGGDDLTLFFGHPDLVMAPQGLKETLEMRSGNGFFPSCQDL